MTETVGDALALLNQTKAALDRANALIERLSRGKPGVLGELVEPTIRIKERLEAEMGTLEQIASRAGL